MYYDNIIIKTFKTSPLPHLKPLKGERKEKQLKKLLKKDMKKNGIKRNGLLKSYNYILVI